jgi:hypothetical protein
VLQHLRGGVGNIRIRIFESPKTVVVPMETHVASVKKTCQLTRNR